jgi:hypothetical protein
MMSPTPPGEDSSESYQDSRKKDSRKGKIDVLSDALRRRSEKDGLGFLSQRDSESENNRRIMADMILRGASLWQEKTGWKPALYEEIERRVPDFAERDFEEAFEVIMSSSYRDFFLYCAEEGPMPDELWEALRKKEQEACRSTRIPIEEVLGSLEKDLTEEEVLELLDTELDDFIELIGYDEETEEIEVRMRSKMREEVGSALAEDLGASESAEFVEVNSGSEVSSDSESSPSGGEVDFDFEAAATYVKRHEATAVLGLLNELRNATVDSPATGQEERRDEILRSLAYPVRRRLLGKPSTLDLSQDPPHEQGLTDAIERYERALMQLDAPRPRYYARQLAKEYPDQRITDSEPHPSRSGQILTLSGEGAPKVTVLGEN